MIIPAPEDIDFIQRYLNDWKGRTSQLLDRPSPVLPLHFDKKYLPSTFCLTQRTSVKNSTLIYSSASLSTLMTRERTARTT